MDKSILDSKLCSLPTSKPTSPMNSRIRPLNEMFACFKAIIITSEANKTDYFIKTMLLSLKLHQGAVNVVSSVASAVELTSSVYYDLILFDLSMEEILFQWHDFNVDQSKKQILLIGFDSTSDQSYSPVISTESEWINRMISLYPKIDYFIYDPLSSHDDFNLILDEVSAQSSHVQSMSSLLDYKPQLAKYHRRETKCLPTNPTRGNVQIYPLDVNYSDMPNISNDSNYQSLTLVSSPMSRKLYTDKMNKKYLNIRTSPDASSSSSSMSAIEGFKRVFNNIISSISPSSSSDIRRTNTFYPSNIQRQSSNRAKTTRNTFTRFFTSTNKFAPIECEDDIVETRSPRKNKPSLVQNFFSGGMLRRNRLRMNYSNHSNMASPRLSLYSNPSCSF